MSWIEQSKANLKFVDWGKLKEGHDKENTLIVKEEEFLQGIVTDIRYKEDGKMKNIKIKMDKHEEEVFIWANASLIRELGYGDDERVIPVEIGNEIRITYFGMYTTKTGQGYDIRVAVNRDITPTK